jgi:hypothetical protein
MTLRISHVKNKNNLKNKILTLYQLVYISKAVKTFSASELKIIFERADKFNQIWNISGTLFYNQDLFFHVLEGEKNTVKTLFTDHISKDTRHIHVKCFFESPVEKRTFPHWNMALYGKKNNEIVNLYQLNEDEITSIENFFQDKITRYFKELVDYFKLTNTD